MQFLKKIVISIFAILITIYTPFFAWADPVKIGSIHPKLSTGARVPTGELEAIGTISSRYGRCSATLIEDDKVLTAAHCLCAEHAKQDCLDRAVFTFDRVYRKIGGTIAGAQHDFGIAGDVHIHPDYDGRDAMCSSDNVDLAVIHLDIPASQVSQVDPIPIEGPHYRPQEGESLTLVGFGRSGTGEELPDGTWECKYDNRRKMKLTLPVSSIDWTTMAFDKKGGHTCGGDSGGPALNADSHVVGVASCGDRKHMSYFEPIYPYYQWIRGVGVGYVKLQNKARGTYLFLDEEENIDGGIPEMWYREKHPDQEWELQYVGDGYVKIKNKSWGKCLNLQSHENKDGGIPNVWECVDHPDQEWKIIHKGKGYVALKNRAWGKCLNNRSERIPNVWECTDHLDQEWRISYIGGGGFLKLTNVVWHKSLNLQKNMDIPNIWGIAEHPDQEWEIQDVGNGYVKIKNKSWGKCLNLQSHENKDGGTPDVWECVDHPDQDWEVLSAGAGQVFIRNRARARCLYLKYEENIDGGIPTVWTCMDHPWMYWKLESAHDVHEWFSNPRGFCRWGMIKK